MQIFERQLERYKQTQEELLSVQDAVALDIEGTGREVRLSGGGSLSASCVLVASGVSYNQLNAPGFERFTGAGIYYGAAMTEARSCQDQSVVVIGGANSAGQAAVYFSKYAGRVIMLVRADSLAKSMSHYLIEQIGALPNVEVRTGWRAVEAQGDDGRVRTLRMAGPATPFVRRATDQPNLIWPVTVALTVTVSIRPSPLADTNGALIDDAVMTGGTVSVMNLSFRTW